MISDPKRANIVHGYLWWVDIVHTNGIGNIIDTGSVYSLWPEIEVEIPLSSGKHPWIFEVEVQFRKKLSASSEGIDRARYRAFIKRLNKRLTALGHDGNLNKLFLKAHWQRVCCVITISPRQPVRTVAGLFFGCPSAWNPSLRHN
jgi:hypothetical protein